jgi:phosphohistidine phosphatase SixA
MILYLMRHANAGVFRENPALDAKRGLVKEGKEQCSRLRRNNLNVTHEPNLSTKQIDQTGCQQLASGRR